METIHSRHCEERSDEAIQTVSAVKSLDCFAEFIIGPAQAGRTRWLAMTKSNVRFR
jgi:pimeloyl-[acyl-carrier protein] methyl ester esterase